MLLEVFTSVWNCVAAERMSMVSHETCSAYEDACIESRKWIEAATKITFPCKDFRESLKDGMLLCKLVEKLSGIKIGHLNPIPRSLAWMDNLVIFLNICRYMGMKKSQLFHVSDLAAVRNQEISLKIKQKEEDRRLRNVLITIFWLGRLAYSLKDYQGPLLKLEAFETLINKTRPPEMVDQQRNKFELDTLDGSSTWPKVSRSSRCQDSSVKEGSLGYFEGMRRQLIPRLTANVKEKAVMYERMQHGVTQDVRRSDERSRSFTSSKLEDNQLSGKTATRAHSFGVLNTSRNRSPNNENKIPFSTGSITKRTPVKVKQSNVLKDHARHYSQEPVKYNRPEQSFQYDSKPIIQGKTPSPHSTVNARSKNKKESDYISVKALIKQWSGPDGKKNLHSQPNYEEKYRNRRSLPANFDASDILSETTKIPQSKSAAEAVHYRGQRSYMSKSDWTLHARVPSDEKRDYPDRKQAYPGKNRLRTKSEPSTYSGRDYDPSLIERNRSSSMKNKDDFNHRDVNNRSRESLIKKREFTQDSYAAIPYPQLKSLKDVRSKDHYSEHGCTSRKSFPLTQKVEVKHVENYMNQKFYHPKDAASVDRQKLESIGKYSTVPEKRTKGNHNENISKNNERAKTIINGDKIGRKIDNKSNKVIERPPRRFSSERNSKSDRRLPTYEEAIIPLEETDAVDAKMSHQINDKKMVEKEYVSIEILQQKRSRDKGKSFNVTRKESDYSPQKQLVNENISKQYATHVYASEVNHPISSSKDATRNYEMLYKRRHSQEKSQDFPSTKTTATPKYKAIGASEFDARKSSNTMHHSNVHEKDMNNNQLPVYDEEALKTLLTSHKKSHEKDNKKEENSFLSNYSKLKEENQGGLNEYERLREEQKVILDEDFKDRSKTHMNPNVARQFTSQDGVSFSNVVHERELLQLVAAEEKYWKEKVERKDKTETKEAPVRQKEIKRFEDDKQERVNEMLREFKRHDQREKIDYSEITDTLRAEEEFLAQEAEKLLKQRFQEKSKMQPTKDLQRDVKKHHDDDSPKVTSPVEGSSSGLHSILKTPRSRQKKSSSVTSSDDINLKPEADQAYHYNRPKRIPRSRSPIYVCSGCRLPVERDICLYVAELQSYWHEKCFRCSVCHSNLIQNEQTPKIRVMFSRIHCENCLSNKRTGGQSTMV